MKRVRLTKRVNANDPGDMDGAREKLQPKMDQYSNFDPAKDDVGDRKVKTWKEDAKLRDEMNITKIKQAKAWKASKLATKLAMYLLGDKAPSSMVKAQASEFLSLGNAKLAKAVARYANTSYLYAEDEEVEAAEEPAVIEEATEQECDEACDCEKCTEAAEEAEEVKEQAEEVEEEAEEVKEQAEEVEEEAEEVKEQAEEEVIDDEEIVEEIEDEEDEITDAELASLFADNSNDVIAPESEKKVAKKGVQKLAQPVKVASSQIDMSDLWAGAPDLSNIF